MHVSKFYEVGIFLLSRPKISTQQHELNHFLFQPYCFSFGAFPISNDTFNRTCFPALQHFVHTHVYFYVVVFRSNRSAISSIVRESSPHFFHSPSLKIGFPHFYLPLIIIIATMQFQSGNRVGSYAPVPVIHPPSLSHRVHFGPPSTPFHSGFNHSTLNRNLTRFFIQDLHWTTVDPIPNDEAEVFQMIAVVPKRLISYSSKKDPISHLVMLFTTEQQEKFKAFQNVFHPCILNHIKGKFANLVQTIFVNIHPPFEIITCQQFRTAGQVIHEFKANPTPDLVEVLCWSMRLLYSVKAHRLILANDIMKSFGIEYEPDSTATSKFQGFVETAISEKRSSFFRPIINHAKAHDIDFVYTSLNTANMPQRIWNALPANLIEENPPLRLPKFLVNVATVPPSVAAPPMTVEPSLNNPIHPNSWPPMSSQSLPFYHSDRSSLSRTIPHGQEPLPIPSATNQRSEHHLVNHAHNNHRFPTGTYHPQAINESLPPAFRTENHPTFPRYSVDVSTTKTLSSSSDDNDVHASDDDDDDLPHMYDPPRNRVSRTNQPSTVVEGPIYSYDTQPIESQETSFPKRPRGSSKPLSSKSRLKKPTNQKSTSNSATFAKKRNKKPTPSKKKMVPTIRVIKKKASTTTSVSRKKIAPVVVSVDTAKENLPEPVCEKHSCQLDYLLPIPQQELGYYQKKDRFMTDASCIDCDIPFVPVSFSGAHYCRRCMEEHDNTDGMHSKIHRLSIICSKCNAVRTSLLGGRKHRKKRIQSV
jgi:hypothetical protein